MKPYLPYNGFYDLREFKLSPKLFKKLWIIQETLHKMQKNQVYYKKWHPGQWQKAQEMSANYQQILFAANRIERETKQMKLF